eukprot:15072400-Alexandrium_andersonii.AAC.1
MQRCRAAAAASWAAWLKTLWVATQSIAHPPAAARLKPGEMAARALASRRLYPRVMCRITVTESPMARTRLSGPSKCQS